MAVAFLGAVLLLAGCSATQGPQKKSATPAGKNASSESLHKQQPAVNSFPPLNRSDYSHTVRGDLTFLMHSTVGKPSGFMHISCRFGRQNAIAREICWTEAFPHAFGSIRMAFGFWGLEEALGVVSYWQPVEKVICTRLLGWQYNCHPNFDFFNGLIEESGHTSSENANMRSRVLRTLTLAVVLGLLPGGILAQEAGIPAKLHPWGRFEPGAWKLVQVVTETLDEQGQVVSTSTTDSKTTLVDVDGEGVTLEIQACMEVAGKRFEAEPQTIKQAFYGDVAVPNLKPKEPVDGHVTIEDRQVACKVLQFEVAGPTGKTATSISYSPTLAPYVLKRESISSNAEGKEVLNDTRVDVLAFDMPVRVFGAIKSGSHMRTICKSPKGTVTTLAVVCPRCPAAWSATVLRKSIQRAEFSAAAP